MKKKLVIAMLMIVVVIGSIIPVFAGPTGGLPPGIPPVPPIAISEPICDDDDDCDGDEDYIPLP